MSKQKPTPADFSNLILRCRVNAEIAEGLQVYRLDAVGLFPESLPYEIYAYVSDGTILGMSAASRSGKECMTIKSNNSRVSFELKAPSLPDDPGCTYITLLCGVPIERPPDLNPPPGAVFFFVELGINDRTWDRQRMATDGVDETINYYLFLEPQQKRCQYKRASTVRHEWRGSFNLDPVLLGSDSKYQTCTVTPLESAPAKESWQVELLGVPKQFAWRVKLMDKLAKSAEPLTYSGWPAPIITVTDCDYGPSSTTRKRGFKKSGIRVYLPNPRL